MGQRQHRLSSLSQQDHVNFLCTGANTFKHDDDDSYSSICIYYTAQPTKSTYKIIKWKQIVDGILHKTILTYCKEYELCCNIAVYIYIENRLFSPLLACFSIFVVVFGGFQFASEFTIVTVIVCFPGGLCFGETEATLCVSFVTFCDYITYNYHYWLEFLNFDIDTLWYTIRKDLC